MAKMKFGSVEETVVTQQEFTLEKALETLKDRLSQLLVMEYKDRHKLLI